MRFKQNGDTIVEVLIAILIVGSSLAVAYQLSNAALRTSTESSLRSQALSYSSLEVELLKAAYNNDPVNFDGNYKTATDYCLLSNQKIIGSCNFNYIFVSKIHYNPLPMDTFTITTTWKSIKNPGQSTQILYYRLPG